LIEKKGEKKREGEKCDRGRGEKREFPEILKGGFPLVHGCISHISVYIGRYQISIEQRVAVTFLVYRLVRSACTTVQNLISNHILSDICHPKGGESTFFEM
jgi:hypothetical protein